jgi:Ca-activated chloride channel family protein
MDVSGSMQGPKIAQARDAALAILGNLNPGDRFNLITFSTGARTWKSDLQEVSDATLADAERWVKRIDATGSTDINRALLEAFAQLDESSDRPVYVLFMTDGLPTQGETDADRIIDNALDNVPAERSLRLFTFGVGYDVNTDLLDILSRELGGRATYVKPDQAIDEVVGDFYNQIGKPVLANVTLDMGRDAGVGDLFPYPLPDLFAGEQLVATGRYQQGGPLEVTLEGEINGEVRTYIYPDQVLAERGGEPFVARLWATRKMGALMEQVRRDGPSDELVDAIVELSLAYGIVSPYTSYLVLEPGMSVEAPAADMTFGDAMRAQAGAVAEAAAAAPASGEMAVASSESVADLADARQVTQSAAVRTIEGKTFLQRGRVTTADGVSVPFWIDTAWDETDKPAQILFGSEEYFDLLSDDAVARMLSLSIEMVLVLEDGSVVRITTLAPEPKP